MFNIKLRKATLLCLLLAVLERADAALSSNQCPLDNPSSRVECGYSLICQQRCEARGCCFDAGIRQPGVPHCFKPLPVVPVATTDTHDKDFYKLIAGSLVTNSAKCFFGSPFTREECGYSLICKARCEARGCCFDEGARQPGVPHCFKPSSQNTLPVATEKTPINDKCKLKSHLELIDCGYPGITQSKCLEIGCCHRQTNNGNSDPSCFIPQDSGFYTISSECSFSSPFSRVDCGFPGISKQQCEERGCCYDNRVEAGSKVPHCFKSLIDLPIEIFGPDTIEDNETKDNKSNTKIISLETPESIRPSCVEIKPSELLDCGFSEITETLCKEVGCCYRDKNSTDPGPTCFFPQIDGSYTSFNECSFSLPFSRVKCGDTGISQEQCEGLGCCYDGRVNGVVPHCFNSSSNPEPFNRTEADTAPIEEGESEETFGNYTTEVPEKPKHEPREENDPTNPDFNHLPVN